MIKEFHFDYDWAKLHFNNYKKILSRLQNPKVLEIGTFQGFTTKFFIENNVKEIHCVDKWDDTQWDNLTINGENVFDYNMLSLKEKYNDINIVKHKKYSHQFLCENIEKYKNYFDIIIIDGSHLPEDVMVDAVLSFKMLKSRGFMVFDDYQYVSNLTKTPKLSIDAFTNIYFSHLEMFEGVEYLGQIILRKRK